MKRSKFLSILLAVMIVMSSFSCLTLTSFAAIGDIVAEGYTPDTEDAEDPADRVTAWQVIESADGYVLNILADPGKPGWAKYAQQIVEVYVKNGVTTLPGKSFYGYENLENVDLTECAGTLSVIEAHAFDGCTALTEITLPNGVSALGDYAFYGCSALTTAKLSASLDVVGKNVFKGCASLTGVTVPNGTKTIGYGMFENCTGLTIVALPDSVESIGEHAFEGCSALTEANVPDSVESVGSYAYYNSGVTSATFGHSVKTMGEYIFGRCSSLQSVTFKSSVGVISDWMFYNCTSLTTITDFPEGVSKIGAHAFEGCTGLTSVEIPNTVIEIADNAFFNASNLNSVKLDSALQTIGCNVFNGTAIASIDIPKDVNTIGSGAFANCSALTDINVEASNSAYTSVDGVLYTTGAEKLLVCPAGKTGDVIIPDTATEIDLSAFAGCSGITSVTIPSSVTIIGANAFTGCDLALTINAMCDSYAAEFATLRGMNVNITHAKTPVETVVTEPTCTTPGEKADHCEACNQNENITTIPALGHTENEGTVTKEPTCTADGIKTFTCINDGCGEVVRTEAIPMLGHRYDPVGTVIKEATCDEDGLIYYYCQNSGCYEYTTKVVPATGHDMDDGVIKTPATCTDDGVIKYSCKDSGCTYSYTDVIPAIGHDYKSVITTPATCEEDGVETLTCANCSDVYTNVIPATGHNFDYNKGEITKYPTVNENGVLENGVIEFPCKNEGCNTVDKQDVTTTAFSGYKYINAGASVTENGIQNLRWVITLNDELIILADGTENEDYSWEDYRNEIVKADIIDAQTISNGSFAGMEKLEEVNIYGTISTIEEYAFQLCPVLEKVYIGSVFNIGNDAFYNCDKLQDVQIDGGLKTVGSYVFAGCEALKNVELGNGTVTVGAHMFEDCINLETVTLPHTISEIGDFAFDDCHSLKDINIEANTVGRYAFHNCKALESIAIGHYTENVGEYAFYGCSSLKTVAIDCGMRSICEGTFMDCTSLDNVTIEESVKNIEKNAFKNCISLTSFDIPVTTEKIGDTAFAGTGLTAIEIPSEVSEISNGAFTSCDSLTDINVDVYNDDYFSIDGVLYDMDLSKLIVCPAGKSGTVKVKDGTTEIIKDAFIGCKNLTVVEISGSVTAIAQNAFNGCADTLVIKTRCDYYANEYAISRDIDTDLTHTTSSWKQTLAPTCLDNGSKQLVCDGCGLVYSTEEIAALGHDYDDGVITTKATCDTDGVVTFTCTREGCGESYTNVIPATNHKMDAGEMIVPVTCETDGTMRYTCTNDGCYHYYDDVVPALGHDYDNGVVTTAPTCIDDGVMTYTCKNAGCGNTYTDVIPATGHDYDDGVVTTAPTCVDEGVMTYTCQNADCGDAYTDVIPATGHSYVSAVTKQPTCTQEGIETHVCSVCGDTYTTPVALAPHQFYSSPVTQAPTCTEEGITGNKCAICNQFIGDTTIIPATGHTYNSTTGMCHCGASNGAQQPSNPGGTVVTPVKPGSGDIATPKMKSIENYGSGKNEGIKITWSKVVAADEYNVYRRSSSKEAWVLIDSTKKTSYVDKTATVGKVWRYTVVSVDSGVESEIGTGLRIKRIPTPHLTGIKNTVNGVKITWNKVSIANSYRVYRSVNGKTWSYIGTSEKTSYTDKSVKNNTGKTYKYTVSAINYYTSACEKGLTIKVVKAPDVKSAVNVSNGVKVTWAGVKNADSYIVYRGEGNGWVRIASGVKGTSYVDKSVNNKNGKKFKYTVKAVDGKYTSGNEKGVSVKVK